MVLRIDFFDKQEVILYLDIIIKMIFVSKKQLLPTSQKKQKIDYFLLFYVFKNFIQMVWKIMKWIILQTQLLVINKMARWVHQTQSKRQDI